MGHIKPYLKRNVWWCGIVILALGCGGEKAESSQSRLASEMARLEELLWLSTPGNLNSNPGIYANVGEN